MDKISIGSCLQMYSACEWPLINGISKLVDHLSRIEIEYLMKYDEDHFRPISPSTFHVRTVHTLTWQHFSRQTRKHQIHLFSTGGNVDKKKLFSTFFHHAMKSISIAVSVAYNRILIWKFRCIPSRQHQPSWFQKQHNLRINHAYCDDLSYLEDQLKFNAY